MSPMPFWPRRSRLLVVAAAVLAACTDSTGPAGPVTGAITVDASHFPAFAYLKLGTPAETVTVANPTASTLWDMGFSTTTVILNGGAAGLGGVSGYCVCEHANATITQLQAYANDPTKQQAVLDSVTVATIPLDPLFVSDTVFIPAINGWYTGTYGSGAINANRTWIIRVVRPGPPADTLLGKFHVLGVQGETVTTPGKLKFEFAIEPAAGQPFGADVTDSADLTGGDPVYYKFTTAGAGTSSDWEIKFDHWNIHLNGGVSGAGNVAAVVLDSPPYPPYASITYAAISQIPSYKLDRFGSVFDLKPWYVYDPAIMQVYTKFNVYLIKRGTTVFKVQQLSYYAANTAPRFITVRYAKLKD